MSIQKRLFDLVCASFLLVVLSPVIVVLVALILLRDGRPVFYISERMKSVDEAFWLIKFRTMTNSASDSGVSGGDKVNRITRTGRMMRAKRLDEIPQLFNILKGDISFVGPRPPLRMYVERFPELYREVLKSRPGVTGLATLAFHRREEDLLAQCRSGAETDAVYARRCVPIKARLDRIYTQNQSLCFDLRLMFATVIRSIPLRQTRSRR